MRQVVKVIWRSVRFPVLLIAVVVICAFLWWKIGAGASAQAAAPPALPGFAAIALPTVGLISLFLGLLHQRRFQRADELLRELAVFREPFHPDYRDMHGLTAGWSEASTKLDPRWIDKHERTVKTVGRFREYRQLFTGAPPYAVAAALLFTLLLVVSMIFWGASIPVARTSGFVLTWAAFAVTVECLSQLLTSLWRIIWFPNAGTDTHLHDRLGIPSWFTLLDAKYLVGRSLPFASFVGSHECYLALTRETEHGLSDWVFSVQLPLPLRGWDWHCVVQQGPRVLVDKCGSVTLSLSESERFFAESGLWMEVEVGRWNVQETPEDGFHLLDATVELSCAVEVQALQLRVKSGQDAAKTGWYRGRQTPDRPLLYPWYGIGWVAQPAEGEPVTARFVRPNQDL